jgi:hypothetical protein
MDCLSGALAGHPESLSRRPFHPPQAMRRFYYGPACAVKATHQKTLDFREEKRFYAQLDTLFVTRKEKKR